MVRMQFTGPDHDAIDSDGAKTTKPVVTNHLDGRVGWHYAVPIGSLTESRNHKRREILHSILARLAARRAIAASGARAVGETALHREGWLK